MKNAVSLIDGTIALPAPHTTVQQSRGATAVAAPDFNFLSETIMVQTNGVIHHHRAMHPHVPATQPAKPGGTGIPLVLHEPLTRLEQEKQAACHRHRILHGDCYESDALNVPRCAISEAIMDDDKRTARHPLLCRLAHIHKPVESKPALDATIEEANDAAVMPLTMGIDPSRSVENIGPKITTPSRRSVASTHAGIVLSPFGRPDVATAEQQELEALPATYIQSASANDVAKEKAARAGAGSAAIADLELNVPATGNVSFMPTDRVLTSGHVLYLAQYLLDPKMLRQIRANIAAMKKAIRLPLHYKPRLGAMMPATSLIQAY